jgi:hypothetical protein
VGEIKEKMAHENKLRNKNSIKSNGSAIYFMMWKLMWMVALTSSLNYLAEFTFENENV